MDITAPLAIAAGEKRGADGAVQTGLLMCVFCPLHIICKTICAPECPVFFPLHTSKKSVCAHFLPCVVSSTIKPR